MRRMKPYLHQKDDWPEFYWDPEMIQHSLGEVRRMQGRVLGKMEALGFDVQTEALLNTLTVDAVKSTEIEGEVLNPEQVRSSVARHLGIDIASSVRSDRNVDGMVEMMLDATQNFEQELTKKRLFKWHSDLFPLGISGNSKIVVGKWREEKGGPMQVISGALGKEKIHFEAPDSALVDREMETFLEWFNESHPRLDVVLKAAIAHLWFLTIHPFDDGNGRIARALTDLLLARSDKTSSRYYSMSAQIRVERKNYYLMLERTQQGTLEITKWIEWFLNCLMNSLLSTEVLLAKVLKKGEFWTRHAQTILNERQKYMLGKLLDDFEGKLNSSKWAKMNKCSSDTALRDIQDLITKGVLRKENAGGRSTNYELI